MLSKKDKSMRISDTISAQDLMQQAFPTRRTGSVKASIYEAYKLIRPMLIKEFTPRRARSIWEGKARRIDGEEMDALREALRLEALREHKEITERLAELDAAFALFDKGETCSTLARKSA